MKCAPLAGMRVTTSSNFALALQQLVETGARVGAHLLGEAVPFRAPVDEDDVGAGIGHRLDELDSFGAGVDLVGRSRHQRAEAADVLRLRHEMLGEIGNRMHDMHAGGSRREGGRRDTRALPTAVSRHLAPHAGLRAALNSARVTTMAMPNSSVAMATSSGVLQRLGEARHAGRARQRDDLRLDRHGAAVGIEAVGFEARLQALQLGTLRLGGGFELAQLHLVIAGADDLLLHLLEALANRRLARGGDRRALFDAFDDLADFALDLPLQAFEVGAQLAHARMRRQQRRRQLGELALDAHALLHEILDQRRTLHVGKRFGGAGTNHLAHRLGARIGFAARGLRPRQLGGDVAELLLVEAGVVGAALEDVGLAAEVLDRGFRLGHFLLELVDLRLQRVLHVVRLREAARRQQSTIGLGEAVGDVGGELGSSDVKRMPMTRLSFGE